MCSLRFLKAPCPSQRISRKSSLSVNAKGAAFLSMCSLMVSWFRKATHPWSAEPIRKRYVKIIEFGRKSHEATK